MNKVINLAEKLADHSVTAGDATMLKAALEYAGKGFPVFPLFPNDKKPLVSGGFKSATIDEKQIRSWWEKTPNANIGIRTGAESGLVVLDVDVKDGQIGKQSLHELCERNREDLPKTLTASTPSGGYHFYFKHMGGVLKNSASKLGQGLDVRGDGGYIVAPPSQIGGKPYRWEESGVQIADMPKWLEIKEASDKGVRSGIGIQEGQRNESIFRLACQLRGKDVRYEDAEVEILFAAESCHPPLPTEEALRCLESAYRYPAGIPVPDELHELNKMHAVVMMRGKFRILNHIIDPHSDLADITFSSPQDFKNLYGNKYVETEKGGTIPLGNLWLASPIRREYKGITFSPGKQVEGYFNLWQGFAVAPKKGDIDLFLQHIHENIAAGNDDVYNYVVGWMADVVQNPSDLLGTSIALRGNQGTGKGVLCNQFGSLFGKHYVHLNSSKHLVGNFNAHLGEAVLVFADEAFWGGDKAAEGSLRRMVTEPTLMIEKKGYDATQVKNHVHLMVASNNEWVVPAGLEERRFLVLDVSNKHQQDHDYFAAIMQQMNNGGREALLHYLQNYDLSSVNLRKLPETKALLETKLLSMSPVQKFWYSKLHNGALDATKDHWNDGEVLCATFQDDYKEFVRDMGGKHRATPEELGAQIRKLIPSMVRSRLSVGGRREYIYTFPTLEECRGHFDKLMKIESDWDSEGAAVKPEAKEADARINF